MKTTPTTTTNDRPRSAPLAPKPAIAPSAIVTPNVPAPIVTPNVPAPVVAPTVAPTIQSFEGYEAEDYARVMPDLEGFETLQASLLAEWLIAHLNPKSVIDVGCGSGFYLPFYADKGILTLGVDAMVPPPKGTRGAANIERFDLRYPYTPRIGNDAMKFDIALCLELVEHLPQAFEDTFFDSLCRCSDTIVFSGAVPGQMGTHHHNEQPIQHWLEQFSKRGYELHSLQPQFKTWLDSLTPLREQYKVCGWLIDHTFILQKQ